MSKRHTLLDDVKTYKLGKRLTVSNVLSNFVLPDLRLKQRRSSTVTSIQREVARFDTWWSTIDKDGLPIAKIRRKHLETYRQWLQEQGHSTALQNNSVRAVMQVLNTAARHELITHSPKLESLPHRAVAPKVFPSDDELNAVWDACDRATWPRRDGNLRPLPYSPAQAWRSALVLYRCYGFRTQELVQLEHGFRSLQWRNLYGPGLTPNPEGKCVCEHGWLAYVPQKQERVKPELLTVPLNAVTKAAISALSLGVHRETDRVFDWPLSAISFRTQWSKLLSIANVHPRQNSGVSDYKIKHLRKAATTGINNHMAGMAEHIVGHGSDRSGQSLVSSKHYNNPEEGVLKCVLTMPLPESFYSLVDV